LTVALAQPPAYFLPSPSAVAAKLAATLVNPSFWPAFGVTFAEALGGCLLGFAVALPLAVLIHRVGFLRAAITPFLGATQAIPAIAVAPVLAIWVGYGIGPIVLLCALMVFFPILVASVLGLRMVDPLVVDAARMDGAGSVALLRRNRAAAGAAVHPGRAPQRVRPVGDGRRGRGDGHGRAGLGQLLTLQRDSVDTAGMFATILVLCAMASALYGVISFIERRSATVADLTGETP
jgi:NitT/TauT family transport system permease protein